MNFVASAFALTFNGVTSPTGFLSVKHPNCFKFIFWFNSSIDECGHFVLISHKINIISILLSYVIKMFFVLFDIRVMNISSYMFINIMMTTDQWISICEYVSSHLLALIDSTFSSLSVNDNFQEVKIPIRHATLWHWVHQIRYSLIILFVVANQSIIV